MQYLKKHWQGKLSLPVAFWVNLIGGLALLKLIEVAILTGAMTNSPVLSARALLALYVVTALVLVWQLVGLWRTADSTLLHGLRRGWAVAARFCVALAAGFMVTLASQATTTYKELYRIAFVPDPFADYTVQLTDNGKLLHLQGGLGFGVTDAVEQVLERHEDIEGIILDSRGGRIYEGRQLASLISTAGLDTYSLTGCYSACGTAFISGERRYLAAGANLAFHQYYTETPSLHDAALLRREQVRDLVYYREQGVSGEFIQRIFAVNSDDLWYPSTEEMIDAGVVHAVVSPSSVQETQYQPSTLFEVDEMLQSMPAMRAINRHEPELYLQMLHMLNQMFIAGASPIEIKQVAGKIIAEMAGSLLPRTSDVAITQFVQETANLLATLHMINPILCMKNIFPTVYGELDITRHLSIQQMTPMMVAFERVIEDSYTTEAGALDVANAQTIVTDVVVSLGLSAHFLHNQRLRGHEDYSAACRTFIRFYDRILALPQREAGNTLRYLFSY